MSDQQNDNGNKPNQNNGNSGGNGPEKGPGPQRPPSPFGRNSLVGWLFLGAMGVFFLIMMTSAGGKETELTPFEFIELAKVLGNFEGDIIIEDAKVVGELTDIGANGLPQKIQPPFRVFFTISQANKEQWTKKLYESAAGGTPIKEDPSSGLWVHFLISWGPFIILALLIYFFVFRSIRNGGGGGGMLGSFGRSRHKVVNKEHSSVTLDDVAGINEAKDEVGEIIEFLKNPKKFQRLGGRVPRGVLLIGQPGCGKTLLAKAVAGEAEVPFFSISGSDFVEMFVGVGASRVRDLFKQAKESSPCIIFLDEIDAVGRRRGNGFSGGGGHDEREQTLNAILVEMDGFETNDQVIVLAATNRNDVLDPALTRPGRFDRQIHVSLPDVQGRYEILKVHSKRIKMGPNVDLEKLARGTPMFSGADLAAIINEAAIGATLQNKDFVEHGDFEEARDKVKWGRARKSHKIEEDERKVIAYHEAGHAIITVFDEDAEPLHKVTIIPRGQALGVTFMLPERDRHIHTRRQLLAQLRMTYGGRIAEDMFCGDISSGAAQDIRQATGIARAMVTEFGMSDKLGFQMLGTDDSRNSWEQPDKLYSDETAELIDSEIKAIIDKTYNESAAMLEEHREQLIALAEALLKYETLTGAEVDRLMKGETLAKSTVSDLIKAEQDKDKAPPLPLPPSDTDTDIPDGTVPTPA
jgi:cell division protease FtsH